MDCTKRLPLAYLGLLLCTSPAWACKVQVDEGWLDGFLPETDMDAILDGDDWPDPSLPGSGGPGGPVPGPYPLEPDPGTGPWPEPGPSPVPQPGSCEFACLEQSQPWLDQCLASGRMPDDCRAEFEGVRDACAVRCASPPYACDRECELRFQQVLEACLDAGFPEDHCRPTAGAAYQRCFNTCGPVAGPMPVPPFPEPTDCGQACEYQVAGLFEECFDETGDRETCRNLSQEAFQRCQAECQAPLAVTCSLPCEPQSEAAWIECLEQGGSESGCAARAETVLETCRALCLDPTVPVPETCPETCRQVAWLASSLCLDQGWDPGACSELEYAVWIRCAADCSSLQDPTDRPEPR